MRLRICRRMKTKEFPWISFRNALFLPGYSFESNDGNTYIGFAHDMTDAGHLYSHKVDVKYRTVDKETHFEKRPCIRPWFKNDGTERIYHRPFWYYGRIYKALEVYV